MYRSRPAAVKSAKLNASNTTHTPLIRPSPDIIYNTQIMAIIDLRILCCYHPHLHSCFSRIRFNKHGFPALRHRTRNCRHHAGPCPPILPHSHPLHPQNLPPKNSNSSPRPNSPPPTNLRPPNRHLPLLPHSR